MALQALPTDHVAPSWVPGQRPPHRQQQPEHIGYRGFSRMSNLFIEQLMPACPEAALKAYVYASRVCREDGTFFISHATLAKKLGLKHRASGQRAISLLRSAGLVEVVTRAGRRGRANDYRIIAIDEVDMERAREALAQGLPWKSRGVRAGRVEVYARGE